MREILTHFLSYLQIPESPPAADTDETAGNKGRKQKEKKKEKPKGKVCINQSIQILILVDFCCQTPTVVAT